jgi:hypothetical protein
MSTLHMADRARRASERRVTPRSRSAPNRVTVPADIAAYHQHEASVAAAKYGELYT